MITVHHLNNSRSQRVLWLLEELGLEYNIKKYERDPDTMLAPPSLKAIHPLGKSPVLTDGDVVVAESGAILEYLLDHYGEGRFKPTSGTPEARRYTYWMHYAEGSLMPMLLLKLVLDRVEAAPVPFFMRPITKMISQKFNEAFVGPQTKLHLDYLEAEMGRHTWFAGEEFTAADVQMSFPLEAMMARWALGARQPKIEAFLKKIQARPAYRKALAKGGAYEF